MDCHTYFKKAVSALNLDMLCFHATSKNLIALEANLNVLNHAIVIKPLYAGKRNAVLQENSFAKFILYL